MKVKELIDILGDIDQDIEVRFSDRDWNVMEDHLEVANIYEVKCPTQPENSAVVFTN